MPARITIQLLKGGSRGPAISGAVREPYSARFRRALGIVSKELAAEIERLGREDISQAGNFRSARWIQGFKAKVWFVGMNPQIHVTSSVPYFRIFEFGGTIRGRPLLWIPLSFAEDAQGVSAKDYKGGLFRVDRKNGGAPLLLSVTRPAKPKYFGKASVRIPKKFHIRTICRSVLATANQRFHRVMRQLTTSVGRKK